MCIRDRCVHKRRCTLPIMCDCLVDRFMCVYADACLYMDTFVYVHNSISMRKFMNVYLAICRFMVISYTNLHVTCRSHWGQGAQKCDENNGRWRDRCRSQEDDWFQVNWYFLSWIPSAHSQHVWQHQRSLKAHGWSVACSFSKFTKAVTKIIFDMWSPLSSALCSLCAAHGSLPRFSFQLINFREEVFPLNIFPRI